MFHINVMIVLIVLLVVLTLLSGFKRTVFVLGYAYFLAYSFAFCLDRWGSEFGMLKVAAWYCVFVLVQALGYWLWQYLQYRKKIKQSNTRHRR
ncbi:hypothetical protein [Pleionea sp. CnH1-48]|uniref:hypothetical protein n=1 Tax=Pleionea sp. CnH1-48 TaxID=2954494 RepID=UPI002096F99A|nr:hypothetical protein [Pleionea sp. CnH1-48]MCO7225905.1 hypothetical protein [Pleionea sp. CnH1-48]